MIGRIEGKLLEKNPPLILVDVHGVGYEISPQPNAAPSANSSKYPASAPARRCPSCPAFPWTPFAKP